MRFVLGLSILWFLIVQSQISLAAVNNRSSDGWFYKDVSVGLVGDIDSADIYSRKSDACTIINVEIADQAGLRRICPIAANFGWLDSQGYIRLSDDTKFRKIKPPDGTYLLAQPNSDIVFIVDEFNVYSQTVILRYYEDFKNHISFSNQGLILDDDYKTVSLEEFNRPVLRQPMIASSIQNNKILVVYDKYVAWFDLQSTGVGYIQSMPMIYSAYMAPIGQSLSEDGRTAAIAGFQSDLMLYKTYSCNPANQDYSCQKVNLTQILKADNEDLTVVIPIRFIGNSKLEVVASFNSGNPKIYRFSVDEQPRNRYLALGDSFASGEGAFDYVYGTDSVNNKCHNSWLAYPYFVDSSALSVACSGAVIDDLNGSNLPQHPGDNLLPGQLNQLDYLNHYYPEMASISVGGNDIGFAQIIKACIDPVDHLRFRSTCYPDNKDRQGLVRQIDDQYLRLVDLYRKVQQITPELYVIGYPQIISPSGSCGLNVMLNDSERQFAVWLTDYLNWTISQAAKQAGAIYVDLSDSLAGHKLCESSMVAVNGVTAGDDMLNVLGHNWLGQESFHPNAYGHQLMALRVQKSIANHTNKEAEKPIDIVSKLEPNQSLNTKYDQAITDDYITTGTSFMISQTETFMPNSQVKLSLSPGNLTLGEVTANDFGNIAANLEISPTETAVGYKKIHLAGISKYGDPIDVYKIIYIDSSESIEPSTKHVYLSFGCSSTLDLPGLR